MPTPATTISHPWRVRMSDLSGVGSSAANVWHVLAEHADLKGACWPSVARIMAHTGMSRATVFRALAALEQAGFITRTGRFTEKGRESNVYRLHPPSHPPSQPPSQPPSHETTPRLKLRLPPSQIETVTLSNELVVPTELPPAPSAPAPTRKRNELFDAAVAELAARGWDPHPGFATEITKVARRSESDVTALAALAAEVCRLHGVRRLAAMPVTERSTLMAQLADLNERHPAGSGLEQAWGRGRMSLLRRLESIRIGSEVQPGRVIAERASRTSQAVEEARALRSGLRMLQGDQP